MTIDQCIANAVQKQNLQKGEKRMSRTITPAKFVLDDAETRTGTLTLRGVSSDRVQRIVDSAFDRPVKLVQYTTSTGTPFGEPRA